jgi:hypothetical protein
MLGVKDSAPKVNDREVGVEEADDATTTWSP